MLDLFLEAAYTKTKQAESAASMQSVLEQLPIDELLAISKGESSLNKLAHYGGGDDAMCWLEHFQGTPLYEEALAIEKRQLELDMQRNADQQKSQGVYNEQDVLRVKRRSLELQLAEQAGGGDELQVEAPEGSPEGVAQTAAPAPSGEGAMNVAKVAATEITPEEAKAIRHHQIAQHLHVLPTASLLGAGIGSLYSKGHGGHGAAIGAGLGAGFGALLTHAANKQLDRHAQTAAAGKMPAENRRHSQGIVDNNYILPISAGVGAMGPGLMTNWNPTVMAVGAGTGAYLAHRGQASNKALLSIDQRARDKTAAMNMAKTSSDLTEDSEQYMHRMRFEMALIKQAFIPAGMMNVAKTAFKKTAIVDILVAGGLGAHYGGRKAVQAGHDYHEGTTRGALGAGGGYLGGSLGGGLLGGALLGGKLGLIAGALGGGYLGGSAGYRHATSQYDKPSGRKSKTAASMTKQAFNPLQAAKNVGQLGMHMAKANPTAAMGLAGAGLGAVGGAISGGARDAQGQTHRLRGALGGAAVGGAAGAAGGYAAPRMAQHMTSGMGVGAALKDTARAGFNDLRAIGGNAFANTKARFMPAAAPGVMKAASVALRFQMALMKQAALSQDLIHGMGELAAKAPKSTVATDVTKMLGRKGSALGGQSYGHIADAARKAPGQSGVFTMKSLAGHHPAVGGGGASVVGW